MRVMPQVDLMKQEVVSGAGLLISNLLHNNLILDTSNSSLRWWTIIMVYKIRDLHSLSTIRIHTLSIQDLNTSSLSLFNPNILNSLFIPNRQKYSTSNFKLTMKIKISVTP